MDGEIQIVETRVVEDQAARLHLWSIYRDFEKFLVYIGDELAGVTLLTNVLEKIPWVNAAYFERRYPERFESGKIYYLPAVVIAPEHQDLRRIGAKLLQTALATLGEDNVLAVDYSETLRQRPT